MLLFHFSLVPFAERNGQMRKKIFFISIIVLYLSSNFILYAITYGHDSLFLLYKIIYGGLFFVILYCAYKYFSEKHK